MNLDGSIPNQLVLPTMMTVPLVVLYRPKRVLHQKEENQKIYGAFCFMCFFFFFVGTALYSTPPSNSLIPCKSHGPLFFFFGFFFFFLFTFFFPHLLTNQRRLSKLNHGVVKQGESAKFPAGGGTERLKVRIYCMKAHSLAPMRAGNSSNPYLELALVIPKGDIADKVYQGEVPGLFSFSDDANFKTNTIEPDFNAWYEMDAILPGISALEIFVKDHGYVRNTLIGSTRIDLEDRWFSKFWRACKDIQQVPRESRVLTNPGTRIPQGTLECWVEMYEPAIAVDIPVVPIAPPKVTEWEMRVVVWETRKVPKLREKRSMNMYVVGEFLYFSSEDSTRGPQQLHETDVHDGVRDGSGKFNWRMKYQVQVPCKHPRLRVQIYDHDMFSLDGFACETVINLETLFREALLSQDEVRRPKKHFRLSSSNHLGENRGEIDLQINLMPITMAEKNPIGNARDAPNEDPFLSDPVRLRTGMFDSPLFRYLKMFFCFALFIGIGVLAVIFLAP